MTKMVWRRRSVRHLPLTLSKSPKRKKPRPHSSFTKVLLTRYYQEYQHLVSHIPAMDDIERGSRHSESISVPNPDKIPPRESAEEKSNTETSDAEPSDTSDSTAGEKLGDNIVVISFRCLQLKRIAELQDELLRLSALVTAEGGD